MKEGVESIQNILQLAAQDDDSCKSCDLLETLNDFLANLSTLLHLKQIKKCLSKLKRF